MLVLVDQNPNNEFFTQWGSSLPSGRMHVVRQTESGTGVSKFDSGRAFGSESRLKGVAQLLNALQIIDGTMLHELMHLWASDLEVIPSVIEGHWGFSSVGGQLGGFQRGELVSLGDGRYSAGNFLPDKAPISVPYSELEMYLAGWIPPNDVPEIWVAEDGQFLSRERTPETLAECEITSGPFLGYLDLDCITQTDANGNRIFLASKISIWNIEQIIEKLGPRTPNVEHSQKEFRVAFVLVTDSSKPVTDRELFIADLNIKQFTAKRPILHVDPSESEHLLNFWEATQGIATLEADDLHSFRR